MVTDPRVHPSRFNRIRSRLSQLFRKSTLTEEDRQRLAERSLKAEHLSAMMLTPGWHVVEEVCQVMQRQCDSLLHLPSATEAQRHDAMIEWNALHDLISNLKLLIKEGQAAHAHLAQAASDRRTSD